MIHKHIFVHAKPGMSEHEFFTYWKDVHAVKYGKQIPQVRGYLINTHVPFGEEPADRPFQGTAEVWIENAEDELAFAQSKEYLQGSRLDEPNFLAWWAMFALDTTDSVVIEPPKAPRSGVKVVTVNKRKPGMPLDEFRTYSREVHAPKVAKIPGLRGYVQCFVNDGHYAVGESLLDSVSLLWFDSPEALAAAVQSDVFRQSVEPDMAAFADPRYFRWILTEESWVVPLEGAA